jgi:soluble lytic murein transglycosylase-like protein
MERRLFNSVWCALAVTALSCGTLFSSATRAQIAKVGNDDGRTLFVNAEPAQLVRIAPRRSSIFLPAEPSFTGKTRASMDLDRDGAEKLVRDASERHRVDPALIRAVIETESNWNAGAISRKGAVGLMQLIPTTAQRFGVNDLYSPQQNVDAGVRYLKTLLERYNGNLDLALAAYNAGEGAVDRAHGVPSFRETRNYVQKVQSAYFRPGSGRLDGAFLNRRAIRKETDNSGRTIFTND